MDSKENRSSRVEIASFTYKVKISGVLSHFCRLFSTQGQENLNPQALGGFKKPHRTKPEFLPNTTRVGTSNFHAALAPELEGLKACGYYLTPGISSGDHLEDQPPIISHIAHLGGE